METQLDKMIKIVESSDKAEEWMVDFVQDMSDHISMIGATNWDQLMSAKVARGDDDDATNSYTEIIEGKSAQVDSFRGYDKETLDHVITKREEAQLFFDRNE